MSTNNSINETSGKCFSGILRRLLCTGSLQTHPSDNYLSELDKIDFNQPKKALKTEADESTQTAATPGVVARLMGLDSMPDINWVPKQRTTIDSIMRSRSVSSVDYSPQFDLTRQSLHRRVRTSASFREVPTYLNQKNHDFIVFCFDKVDEIRSNGEVGRKEVKEKKAERNKNDTDCSRERNLVKKKDNQESSKRLSGRTENSKRVENVIVDKKKGVYRQSNGILKGKSPLKPVNHKEVCVQLKYRKQRKKADSQCKSVNSVASTSGAKELISPKRSPSKVEKFKNPCPDFRGKRNADNQELRAIHKKVDKPLITGLENDYFSKMSVQVFRLTEEDTKGSDWPLFSREVFKFQDFEEICIKFGEDIFQRLLNQIVNELCI